MGTFETRVGVSDGNGGDMEWVDATVDTGATYTVLPDSLLREQLGLSPEEDMVFTFADGAEKTLPVGQARLRVNDRERMNVVVFGEEGQYLLGATSLQVFGFIADTTNHKLIPAPKLLI